MIYRIDVQHFLTHAIDHFDAEQLSHFQYAIISASILNGGRRFNVIKSNMLYPPPEIVMEYAENKDKSIMEKMFMDYLNPKDDDDSISKNSMDNIFYRTFINPLLNHYDVVIVCNKSENDYIDVICKVLKKEYLIEVIDLNQLFSKGKVGNIYIDRDDIKNNAVPICRKSADDERKNLETTSDGRRKLLMSMSKKAKLKKIKEIGINTNNINKSDIDKILIDGWVNDD